MSTQVLLADARLFDEAQSLACEDPYYLPFYYHLGAQVSPRLVVQFGAVLGLVGHCFLKACPSVEEWWAMDDNKMAARVVEANLRPVGSFSLLEENLLKLGGLDSWRVGLGLVTGCFVPARLGIFFGFVWDHLEPEGLLVVDYIRQDGPTRQAFEYFCATHNRKPEVFDTRYGTGIVVR